MPKAKRISEINEPSLTGFGFVFELIVSAGFSILNSGSDKTSLTVIGHIERHHKIKIRRYVTNTRG